MTNNPFANTCINISPTSYYIVPKNGSIILNLQPRFISFNVIGMFSCTVLCWCRLQSLIFALGQTDCLQCPVGAYQDEEGQMSCKNCTENTFQDLEAQLSCKDCSNYKQCTNQGRTECHSKLYSNRLKTHNQMFPMIIVFFLFLY